MVTIKFFAVLKSLAGKAEMSIQVEKETSLARLLRRLEDEVPPLKEVIQEGKVLISVNQEVVEKTYQIKDGDEIALLPPFAGG